MNTKRTPARFSVSIIIITIIFQLLPSVVFVQAEDVTPTPLVVSNTNVLNETTTAVNTEETVQQAVAGDPETTDPAPNNQITNQNNKTLKTDPSSGALVYSYDLTIPPGRKGLTPELQLNYNSQSAALNSPFGYGWSISIPFIERINKEGSDNLYIADNYTSSLSGELEKIGNNSYRAKAENGSFFAYTLTNNTWVVTDKQGNQYIFGASADSRQDDSADTTRIYKWMLSEIRDTNNNFIHYEYYKDVGQIYPEIIYYTGSGTTNGIFTIHFIRENRTDISTSYTTDFLVQTNYRIAEIKVDINNDWVKQYTLNYKTSDNQYSSLLSSIIISSKDNNQIINLPPISFNYTTSTPGWAYDASWKLPIPVINESNLQDFGMRFGDINGDGLVDILCHNELSNGNCNKRSEKILLNTGSGWVTSNWVFPIKAYSYNNNESSTETFISATGVDTGLRLVDINGDNLPDLIKGDGNMLTNYVYINTGTGWSYDSSKNLPIPIINKNGLSDFGMRMEDINGDGLVDIVCQNELSNGNCNKGNPSIIFLNTGSGWTDGSAKWDFPKKVNETTKPEAFVNKQGGDTGLRLVDINGDNLPDLVKGEGSNKYIYLNTGSGWAYDASWKLPIPVINESNLQDFGMRFGDINGDGLVDILCHNELVNGKCDKSESEILMNSSSKFFDVNSTWTFPAKNDDNNQTENFVTKQGFDTGLRLVDINGDNLPDLIKRDGVLGSNYIYINTTYVRTNLLQKITTEQGGYTEITYKTSAEQKDTTGTLLNPHLPIAVTTVSSITTNDGLGHSATTQYSYEGGSYYYNTPTDRKFAGFNVVTTIPPDGSITKTYYHQGNTTDTNKGEYNDKRNKIGKAYRTETYDANGNLYKREITKWDSSALGSDSEFVYTSTTLTQQFDGGSTSYDTAVAYEYDSVTGNITKQIQYGTVSGNTDGTFTDTGSDKRTTEYSYAVGNNGINLLSEEKLKDSNGVQVAYTRKYYDGQALGTATLGNLTKESKWISGTSYADTTYTYNSYGMVTDSTDPIGNTTSTTYDTYNMYPATITNALNQTTTYTYDYKTGAPVSITDANNAVITNTYDGLGRLTKVVGPDPSTGSQATYTEINYVDNAVSGTTVPYKITTTYQSPTLSGNTYELYDGLGRTIRTIQMVDLSTFIASDTTYDNMGRVATSSLPYVSNGSLSYSGVLAPNGLIKTLAYDTLGRIKSEATVLGTTSYSYTGNKTILTTPEGKVTDVYKNAFDSITQVGKHLGATINTTAYIWNTRGDLIGMTDSMGNMRIATYDALGRRLSMTDLHSMADTTYGTYTYEYDKNSNMTKKTTPRSHVITYTYDALNRALTEVLGGVTKKSYIYDNCTNGIGHICEAQVAGGATTNYTYAKNGAVASESIIYGGKTFTTTITNTLTKSPTLITYPNTGIIKYNRDFAGRVTSVEYKAPMAPIFSTIATITFGANSLPEKIAHSNTINDEYTYDHTQYYALTEMTVGANGGTPLLSEKYTWSADKNLTQKIDDTDPNIEHTYSYTYDDLDRLLTAAETVPNSFPLYFQTYSYNTLGNIISGPSGTYTYNGTQPNDYANPHAVKSIGGTFMSYDQNGNTTNIGNATLTYDYKDKMTSYVNNVTGVNMQMQYDANENRIKTVDSSGTTYTPSSAYEEKGTNKTVYIYNGDILLATAITDANNTTTINHIHSDYLGSNRVTTDTTATLIDSTTYYPYGTIASSTTAPSYTDPHKYTGTRYDKDTDLNFMQARYQSGSQARFLSQDPVFWVFNVTTNPDTLNSYTYANNNPLKNKDTDGNFAQIAIGVAGGGLIGGAIGGVAAYLTGGSIWQGIKQGAISGAVTGAVISSGGLAAGALGLTSSEALIGGSAIGNALGGAAGRASVGQSTSLADVGIDTVIGGAGGMIAGAFGSNSGNNISKIINPGRQDKHIVGTNNYKGGKGILETNAQALLDDFHSGNINSSQKINATKTRVDFGKTIGTYLSENGKVNLPTTRGIIINSKDGAHIMPSRPNKN